MNEARETADSLVSPRQIALTYDRVISAHWRGETDTATAFDEWFEAHWSDQAPPEPDAPPEGTSVLGGSGAGIRWYARDETVLGYVSRRSDGCYRVPMREALPALLASWDILEFEATRLPDSDQLLRHQSDTSLLSAIGPDGTAQQVQDSAGSATQEPSVSEMLVAVHIFDATPAENSAGVPAGS
jgi:hypothetical protein